MTEELFTVEELLRAAKVYVAKYAPTEDSGDPSAGARLEHGTFTRPSFMDEHGIGLAAAKRIIAKMLEDGVIIYDKVEMAMPWGGNPQKVNGYRFVALPKEEPDQMAGLGKEEPDAQRAAPMAD